MLKIAFVEIETDWEKVYLKKTFPSALFFSKPAQDVAVELARAKIDVLSVFIKSKVDKTFLLKIPSLRLITTRSTGFDHIDTVFARKKGVTVCHVPVYGENTVAEHTFALILSLARQLRKAYLRTVQGNFSLDGLMGFDLKGKTLGVVGTGHIGMHVIRMGLGFGMKVIAFDVKPQNFLAEMLPFNYVGLKDLLKQSDIITLHVPYMPATHHLINSKTLAHVKKGAVLINTSRGGLVDTSALVKALDEKILNAVGLDVLEDEEYLLEEKRLLEESAKSKHWVKLKNTLKNHVLLARENVIYTPHMAFYSREAVQRILDTTLENIRAFANENPIHQV